MNSILRASFGFAFAMVSASLALFGTPTLPAFAEQPYYSYRCSTAELIDAFRKRHGQELPLQLFVCQDDELNYMHGRMRSAFYAANFAANAGVNIRQIEREQDAWIDALPRRCGGTGDMASFSQSQRASVRQCLSKLYLARRAEIERRVPRVRLVYSANNVLCPKLHEAWMQQVDNWIGYTNFFFRFDEIARHVGFHDVEWVDHARTQLTTIRDARDYAYTNGVRTFKFDLSGHGEPRLIVMRFFQRKPEVDFETRVFVLDKRVSLEGGKLPPAIVEKLDLPRNGATYPDFVERVFETYPTALIDPILQRGSNSKPDWCDQCEVAQTPFIFENELYFLIGYPSFFEANVAVKLDSNLDRTPTCVLRR